MPMRLCVGFAAIRLIWAKSRWHSKASCRPAIAPARFVRRLRTLVKKTPDRNDRLDINETILDIIGLTRAEMQRNGVSLVDEDRAVLAELDPGLQRHLHSGRDGS
jgi:hypothetical protein